MLTVPLQPVPSQIISVTLNNQACQITVRQVSTGVFISLSVSGTLIVAGIIALHNNLIVRSAWLGFIGDIAMVDLSPGPDGPLDPDYRGFGTRWQLVYYFPDELPAGLA